MIACDGCARFTPLPLCGSYVPPKGPAIDVVLCGTCASRLRKRDRGFLELLEARLLLWAQKGEARA